MNLFRRTPPPAPPHPAPHDGWAPTCVEPLAAEGGWAETTVDDTPPPTGWEETRAQTAIATRLLGETDDELAGPGEDIGRLTSADTRELFVSCDAADALQQQFDHLQPDFIALHDIGTASSRPLLQALAGASGRRVQRLVIRRQGYGTPLATIEFVDLPTAQGKALRLYSTDTEAEPAAREALVRTLLGFSRIGAVMVGDLAAPAMAQAFKPFADAMVTSAWRNRQLLLLPLAAAGSLVSHGISLGQASGVSVRTTPQVLRAADAWNFIAASWSRFGDPVSLRWSPAAPTTITLRPMPVVGSRPTIAAPAANGLFERYLRQLGDIAGMVGCCVFEIASGKAVAHAGVGPDAAQLALHGGQLLTAIGLASRSLGFGRMVPDTSITLGAHHLLLRGVPKHPGHALHVVLDKHVANLTLARLQLQRMDPLFDAPGG